MRKIITDNLYSDYGIHHCGAVAGEFQDKSTQSISTIYEDQGAISQDSYWLGWISYNNLPLAMQHNRVEMTDEKISFINDTKPDNYPCGYVLAQDYLNTCEYIRNNVPHISSSYVPAIRFLNELHPEYSARRGESPSGVSFPDQQDLTFLYFLKINGEIQPRHQTFNLPIPDVHIYFDTSSNNGIKGLLSFLDGKQIITVSIEHPQGINTFDFNFSEDFAKKGYTEIISNENENISGIFICSALTQSIPTISNGPNGNNFFRTMFAAKVKCDEGSYCCCLGNEPLYKTLLGHFINNNYSRLDTDTHISGFSGEFYLNEIKELDETKYLIDNNILAWGKKKTSGNSDVWFAPILNAEEIKKQFSLMYRVDTSYETMSYVKDVSYATDVSEDDEFLAKLKTGDITDQNFKGSLRLWQGGGFSDNTFTENDIPSYVSPDVIPSEEEIQGLNYQGFIDNLIDGSWGNNLDNFSGQTLLDDEQVNYSRRINFLWHQLLLHMHNKFATFDDNIYHYGIREKDFPRFEESIVEFINNNIDLDSDEISILDKYFQNKISDDQHWNESIAKLADYYYKIFKEAENNTEIDSTNITISDLKNADAGNAFSDFEKWVIPWENIDKDNYAYVRNNDKIKSVLNNSNNLQFTQHKQLNQYLRLIMPEYKRIVEVEDLNRNFWVIGQALTALCGFLFDDESLLPNLLSALLDEITQLWENIFFLWLFYSIASQKEKNQEIQAIFLPVSNISLFPNVKFDNFSNIYSEDIQEKLDNIKEADPEELKQILKYIWNDKQNFLKDKYNNCSIIFFPEIRLNNYQRNLYSKVIYPGAIFYNNITEKTDEQVNFIPFDGAYIIDLKEEEIITPNIPTSSESINSGN